MLFNSLDFVLFFPVVVGLYFALPYRWRWGFLLAASYYFYACWKVAYLTLIIASTLVDYWAGLQMGKRETRSARRPFLLVSLAANLGILFTFKYFNFFGETVNTFLALVNSSQHIGVLDVLLPVGISFYTFQTLAYSIDVYRGRQQPEHHLGIFALYVSFFPQLVAGPIERSQNLLPQFRRHHQFDYNLAVSGLRLMLWGFFLKLVLADRVALFVDAVYNNPGTYQGTAVVMATYFFAFQIYGDFAGYSLIAIGCARVMGYDLMQNFRSPYFAASIGEFWRRWHISLSTWFRDYLYIPLGGNRVKRSRWYANLFIVFTVSGLWHGAAWTFVVWGALHGLYLIAGLATADWRERAWARLRSWYHLSPYARAQFSIAGVQVRPSSFRKGLACVLTFHLVLVAWVFFRAGSIQDVVTLFDAAGQGDISTDQLIGVAGAYTLVLGTLAVATVVTAEWVSGDEDFDAWIARRSMPVRWLIYMSLLVAIALFGVFDSAAFIYFQF